MPKPKFRDDADAWHATVAEAFLIADRAMTAKRDYLPQERRQVDALIAKAEKALGLVGIPRDAAELVAYYHRDGKQYGAVAVETPLLAPTAGEHVAADDDGHGDRVDRATPAAACPDPADDVEEVKVYLSCSDLAKKYRVGPSALLKRLERWRWSHDEGYVETHNTRSRSPKYLYVEAAALPVIHALIRGE